MSHRGFGSSRFVDDSRSWTGGVVGAIHCAAPELYFNPPYSSEIDVFAFGLIHNEPLVGRPVFLPICREERVMWMALNMIRADLPEWIGYDVHMLITRCWAAKPEPLTVVLAVTSSEDLKILTR
jgi:serine/threonine protein kinase